MGIMVGRNNYLMKMRNSQKIVFWRDHKVFEIRKGEKILGWIGVKIPKTAEELLEEGK